LPASLRAGLALELHVVVEGDRLGADEALLEVAVDDAGRLRRGRARADRPGARFFRADGEVGLQAEELVAGADDAVEAGLGEAEAREEFLLLFVGSCATRISILPEITTAAPFGRACVRRRCRELGVARRGGLVLVDVADVEDGLGRQQLSILKGLLILGTSIFARRAGLPARAAASAFDQGERLPCFLVAARAFFSTFRASRGCRDRRASARSRWTRSRPERIDLAVDVDDVVVVEAAHDVGDGVDFADVGEELVAEALALAAPGRGPAMSTKFMRVGDDLLRAGDLRQRRGADRARRRRRRSARWCRTDSSPPAPPPCGSAR
jgi:hypothetical protein